jgi:hypothetical protein
MEPTETAVARQGLSRRHVIAATDTHTHTHSNGSGVFCAVRAKVI